MAKSKGTERAAPHSRKKVAKRDAAAMTLDELWAKGIEESLLADAHDYQGEAILDPALRISLLIGRGGGKTTALRARALIKITRKRNARVAYVATSRPEAERLNWEPLKQLIDDLGLRDDFEFIESKMICRCKRTGGTYQFFGADDKREINKLRGQPFDEFQVDEAASHDIKLLEEMLDRAIGPRLGERGGCIVLAGTPGHMLHGRFYDVTVPGSEKHRPYAQRQLPEFKKWIGWSSHSWNMLQILALPKARQRYVALVKNWEAALVEKESQQWTDDNPIWKREYLGLWAADNTTSMYSYAAKIDGVRFNQWNPYGGRKLEGLQALEAAIRALPKDRDDYLFGYGMDLGSRDPFALVIKAFSPTDPERKIRQVFGFERRRMYPRTIAELLIGEEAVRLALRGETYDELGGCFGLTGWPVAAVADLAGLGEMVLDELANVYGIRVKPAEKKGKASAIEVYNGDLTDGRMLILEDSVLELQLSTLQWKPDEYGLPKEDKAAQNHSADAATYIRTEIGPMFSASSPPPKSAQSGDKPTGERAKPRVERDTWNEQPQRSKKSGEFDALLGDNDFTHIDGWGNG